MNTGKIPRHSEGKTIKLLSVSSVIVLCMEFCKKEQANKTKQNKTKIPFVHLTS